MLQRPIQLHFHSWILFNDLLVFPQFCSQSGPHHKFSLAFSTSSDQMFPQSISICFSHPLSISIFVSLISLYYPLQIIKHLHYPSVVHVVHLLYMCNTICCGLSQKTLSLRFHKLFVHYSPIHNGVLVEIQGGIFLNGL